MKNKHCGRGFEEVGARILKVEDYLTFLPTRILPTSYMLLCVNYSWGNRWQHNMSSASLFTELARLWV
jgi:hypothetical protein